MTPKKSARGCAPRPPKNRIGNGNIVPDPGLNVNQTRADGRSRPRGGFKSQVELAEAIGVSQSMISRILKGERFPSRRLAERLAQVSGLHRDAWLYPSPENNPWIYTEKQGGAA